MAMVNKAVAVYLLLTALAVAVLLMVTPLIHDGSDSYPIWEILNYFMAAGVITTLVANYICKRRRTPTTRATSAAAWSSTAPSS